jgi:hypothetical protein
MPIERVRMDGARIRQVVSELTGKPCGEIIEHKSGRVDATARPPTVEVGFEHLGITMSEMQKRQYHHFRNNLGYSREKALFLLTPQ